MFQGVLPDFFLLLSDPLYCDIKATTATATILVLLLLAWLPYSNYFDHSGSELDFIFYILSSCFLDTRAKED